MLACSDQAGCDAPSISVARVLSDLNMCPVPPTTDPQSGHLLSLVAPPQSAIQYTWPASKQNKHYTKKYFKIKPWYQNAGP